MKPDNKEILSYYMNNDLGSFHALMDGYKSGVYALVYSELLNPRDAENITQEAFLKAYNNLHRWDPDVDFNTWICSIALNLCSNWAEYPDHVVTMD